MRDHSDQLHFRRSSGFTMAELVVVMTIILVLAAILIPLVHKSMQSAKRTGMAADLQAISTALEAYKQDHGDYPRPTLVNEGPSKLCQGLIGPAGAAVDLADGPGFKVRAQGRTFGPYLPLDKFRMADPLDAEEDVKLHDLDKLALLDPNAERRDQTPPYWNPILYYPARAGKPNINLNDGYVGNTNASMFNSEHNLDWVPEETLEQTLGDVNNSGGIDSGEQAAFTGPFILWTTGPDGRFGTDDDVTNFNMNP